MFADPQKRDNVPAKGNGIVSGQSAPYTLPLEAGINTTNNTTLSSLKPRESDLTPEQNIKRIYHSTSILSLPLIFRFGLYLSAERFTVFFSKPPTSWGWTDTLVALVVRVPSNLIDDSRGSHPCLGLPEPVKFPERLRAELQRLDAKWEPDDNMWDNTRKSRSFWNAVNGAHWLLKEEQAGTLRHFPTEWFDIQKSREGNQFGRHRAIANAYLDALEKNNGKPLDSNVSLPPFWVRWFDALSFPIRKKLAGEN